MRTKRIKKNQNEYANQPFLNHIAIDKNQLLHSKAAESHCTCTSNPTHSEQQHHLLISDFGERKKPLFCVIFFVAVPCNPRSSCAWGEASNLVEMLATNTETVLPAPAYLRVGLSLKHGSALFCDTLACSLHLP